MTMSSLMQCRMCSSNPFGALFGGEEESKPAKQTVKKCRARDPSNFEARNDDDVQKLIEQWEQYAHPRAREFFPTQEMLREVLGQLAKGIQKTDDPVLSDDACVYWYGDITRDDQQAAIRMMKPGETAESVTYVNRVLAFIFATDESFEQLMRLPKEPFKMSCGDQLCVNLAHISLSVADGGA